MQRDPFLQMRTASVEGLGTLVVWIYRLTDGRAEISWSYERDGASSVYLHADQVPDLVTALVAASSGAGASSDPTPLVVSSDEREPAERQARLSINPEGAAVRLSVSTQGAGPSDLRLPAPAVLRVVGTLRALIRQSGR